MPALSSQNIWVSSLAGLLAMALLVLSADLAVKKLIRIAAYFQLSATFMGMTVLSLATSIPEITSHLTASVGILRGTLDYKVSSSIVLGANIGSNVVQQTFIMGIVVFMAGSLRFRRYFLFKSLGPMIGTALICIILGWDRTYSFLDGFILFGTFALYTYYLYVDERKHFKVEDNIPAETEAKVPGTGRQTARDALIAIAAWMVTVISAQIVLSITERVVAVTGISGSLIGVVTLGVASALPELTTAISGVGNKEQGISLGTLVGSNITNPLVGIGGGALLSTYWVPGPVLYWDLPWQAIGGLLLWVILLTTKGRLNRVGAMYLIGMYVIYLTIRAIYFAVD
jgi:cation:H+ antiporter